MSRFIKTGTIKSHLEEFHIFTSTSNQNTYETVFT